ncbi:MAG: isoleucine--tRNA ligase [Alphaproteobacteria bacterium]|nr:isoleucine--tRNA ligase [Alphaproteobacteria bacterium]
MTELPDLKHTVCLPKTDFPMRAKLPELEPKMLARWSEIQLWQKIRQQSVGREKFILHDGPPYANGHLHIGHALNKILKDIVNRNFQKMGRDANYVPGWDCHGLPIEWKVEEQYRAKNLNKDEVPINEFRGECRRFAAYWMGVQAEEFRRLGVFCDWENPYSTMSFAAEATIVREIGKFLMNGYVFRRERPVMWSVVEKTVLADAEIEYEEIKSPSITVRFPIQHASIPALEGVSVLIWTTTPWTIPCNRAVALQIKFTYQVIRITEATEKSGAVIGEKVLLAEDCVVRAMAEAGVTGYEVVFACPAQGLAGCVAGHPLRALGFDHDVPLLFGEYVTNEQGTGCVHAAPGHGVDDHRLCQEHGIETPVTVMADGRYHDSVPMMQGHEVITEEGVFGSANGHVIRMLLAQEQMFTKGSVRHNYPHSWRSKKPVIYRATAQWFISMEHKNLRARVLAEIAKTRFVPSQGQSRLHSLVAARPDWCISRQRAWGVPIAIFIDQRTGEPLQDPEVMERIAKAFAEEGADCWFDSPAGRFLGSAYNPADYEQIFDVVDVWFDSGSSHSFVLEAREDLQSPASLYLEGSDQHRGFFHSSILQSTGTRGRAPYQAVLTHGFTLDEKGQKMSKSLGNIISPQQINDAYGAEILRLWVATLDYSHDMRIGEEILKGVVDIYRRMRNTLRWLMGNLHYYDQNRKVLPGNMPELERLILHRLYEIDQQLRDSQMRFDIQQATRLLFQFCNQDLSAFYFDLRKDTLYCDARDDHKRLSALTMSAMLFDILTVWLSPVLTFTTEEAWIIQTGDVAENSVHLRDYPVIPPEWYQPELAARWEIVLNVRKVVLGALEVERKAGNIKSALETHPVVFVADPDIQDAIKGIDLAELCITAGCDIVVDSAPKNAFHLNEDRNIAVIITPANGEKCARCWKVTIPDTRLLYTKPLCQRCVGVLLRDFHLS